MSDEKPAYILVDVIIKNDEKMIKYFDQKNIKKKIYIKDKLLNIIT